MKKSDVKLSYHQGYGHWDNRPPMVNVKVYADTSWSGLVKVATKHITDFPDALFLPWLRKREDDEYSRAYQREWDAAWEIALEIGWGHLSDDLANSGLGGKVYGAGRSGGWAVVEGLPPVKSWDAVMLMRWSRWAKWARQQADDIPYLMVDHLYHNVFPRERAKVDACVAQAIRDAGGDA